MNAKNNIILFLDAECFTLSKHSLYAGGINMKVTHQHPKYTNEKERLDKLQELKKACAMKIRKLNSAHSA